MATWPILSVTTFLPLVGVLFIAHAARGRGRRPQRALGGALDHAGHLRGLAQSGVALRSGLAGIPVRREAPLARRLRHLSHGRRRHFAAARDPHHRDHAALHRGELARHPGPRPRIHDRVPGAGNADGRHLLGARPRAVLPVLRGRPHPDVPDHRRVGRPAPGLCELQVLPLHARRLGADAARHHGDVLAVRHDRHHRAAAPRLPARDAAVAVDRLLRLVRGEAADVAGAHLAARRPRRGADRGLGRPRRDPAEDGRLRVPALLAADVPARFGGFRAASCSRCR